LIDASPVTGIPVSGQIFGFGVGVGVGGGVGGPVGVVAWVATATALELGEPTATGVAPPPQALATSVQMNRTTVAFRASFGVIGAPNRSSARPMEPDRRAAVWVLMRSPALVLVVLVMAACASSASGTPTAASAGPSATGALDCSFTKPANATPPPLPATRADQNEAFTAAGRPLFVHFNESLAVRLPVDGTFLVGPGDDGVKLGWIRLKDGPLTVSAKRLDVPGVVQVDMADNYGNSGLQVTGIRFRAAGCYSVTGSVAGGAPLTFVTRVIAR
jgi:hypothetical protein